MKFRRELEGGLYEAIEMDLPALLAVATGLNEPRFVSIRAVRKVAGIEIPITAPCGFRRRCVQDRRHRGQNSDREHGDATGRRRSRNHLGEPRKKLLRKLAEILKEKGGIL